MAFESVKISATSTPMHKLNMGIKVTARNAFRPCKASMKEFLYENN